MSHDSCRSARGDDASDEAESIATIHAALHRGVNVIDTGDFYGMGKNELLVGRALQGRRDKALLSVKFGALRGHDGVSIVPTIGARTRKQITDALASLDVTLEASEVAALEAAVPASQVAGTRYGQEQMAVLDSEG